MEERLGTCRTSKQDRRKEREKYKLIKKKGEKLEKGDKNAEVRGNTKRRVKLARRQEGIGRVSELNFCQVR